MPGTVSAASDTWFQLVPDLGVACTQALPLRTAECIKGFDLGRRDPDLSVRVDKRWCVSSRRFGSLATYQFLSIPFSKF